jgi:hypothetical protein
MVFAGKETVKLTVLGRVLQYYIIAFSAS